MGRVRAETHPGDQNRIPGQVCDRLPTLRSGGRVSDDTGARELLRRLGELRDTGILTQDEFEAQKRDVLARL